MRKISILLVIIAMALTLAGCGGESSDASDSAGGTDDALVFTYDGTEIALDADAEGIISALGEPKNYTEEPSCAFEGLDKTYYYGGFYMTTYPSDNGDRVYSIWFADDSVQTADGIKIGDSQEKVEECYGADSASGESAYTLTSGEGRLTVIVEDGAVSSVSYELIVD